MRTNDTFTSIRGPPSTMALFQLMKVLIIVKVSWYKMPQTLSVNLLDATLPLRRRKETKERPTRRNTTGKKNLGDFYIYISVLLMSGEEFLCNNHNNVISISSVRLL